MWLCRVALLFAALCACAWADDSLRVVSITPYVESASHRGDSVQLRGQDAITVTFNRPVIPLGSDYADGDLPEELVPFELAGSAVPGRVRWVTTYMARFDADVPWPAEVRIDLRVRDDLVSHDGLRLDCSATSTLQSPCRAAFHTAPLTMSVGSVRSAIAEELTAGQWDASVAPFGEAATRREAVYEMPRDAQVELNFNSPVVPSLLEQSLQLRDRSDPSIRFGLVLERCAHELRLPELGRRCVVVSLAKSHDGTNELAVDQRAEIVLPRHVPFHPYSSESSADLLAQVSGPYSFRIPFTEGGRLRPRFYRYQMWLRHGLNAHSSLTDLEECFTISPSTPFSLRQRAAAVLELEAAFHPDTQYTLAVKACDAVIDGLGLPLLDSSITLHTAPWPTFVSGAQFDAVMSYERDDAFDELTLFARTHAHSAPPPRGLPDVHVSAVSREQVKQLIVALNSNPGGAVPWEGAATAAIDRTVSESSLQDIAVDLAPVRAASTVVLVQQYVSYYSDNYQLRSEALSFSSLSVVFLADSSGSPVRAWVTSTVTGEPVDGAQVAVYSAPWNPSLSSVRAMDTGTTNFMGIASLAVDDTYVRLYALVTTADDMLFVNAVPRMYRSTERPQKAVMALDRGIYKPGDEVYVKGYVRQVEAPDEIPAQRDYYVSVVWGSDGKQTTTDVSIDGTFGAFDATLTVPADASYGMHWASLNVRGTDHNTGSFTLLVADPRPPTVKLNETAVAPIYGVGAGVPLSLSTRTYVGTAVPNAEVTLEWRLVRGLLSSSRGQRNPTGMVYGCGWTSPAAVAPSTARTARPSNDAGELKKSTGDDGALDFVFQLEDLEVPPVEGDTVTVDAEWVGPTGELTQDSVSVPVWSTPVRLGLEPTSADPLPGFEFSVRLAAETADGARVPPLDVTVSLFHWDGATPIVLDRESGKLMTAGGAALEQEFDKVSTCQGVADDGARAQCALVLPDMGVFVLVAEAITADGDVVAVTYPVGRTEAEWQADPLRGLSEAVRLRPDQAEYELGQSAILSLYNPFPRARTLVLIGNAQDKRMWLQELHGGEADISVTVDAEQCTGGCRVLVVLFSPRDRSLELPVDVPMSPLFDPFAPATLIAEVTLSVRDGRRALPGLAASLSDAVVAPEHETVEMTVAIAPPPNQLDRFSELELCVFVVDRAWLDLRDAPMPDLAAEFATDLLDWMATSASSVHLALNSGYQAARDTYRRRMAQNEWVTPEDWTVQSHPYRITSIELTDEAYFDSQFAKITAMPRISRPTDDYYLEYEDEALPLAGDAEADGGGGKAGGAAPVPAPRPNAAADDSRVMAAAAMAGDGAAAAVAGHVRHETSPTPFHAMSQRVQLSGDMTASLSLRVPENVGTYAVRVFAVSSDSAFAIAETEMTVRKPVNLHADMPRIGRVGDRVRVGATVTVADPHFHGQVRLRVRADCTRLAFLEEPVREVEIAPGSDGGAPIEVQFAARLLELGSGSVEVEAVQLVDGQERSLDGIGTTVEILPPQQEVFVSTSMALRAAGERKEWDEGLQMPPALRGTGVLSLEAGVGYLPSVETYGRTLIHMRPYASAVDLVSSLTPRIALEVYPGPLPLSQQVHEHFVRSVHVLKSYTDASFGLQWTAPIRNAYYAPWLDAYALHVANRVHAGGLPERVPEALTSVWAEALSRGLYDMIDRSASHDFQSFDLLADTYLALGTRWTPTRYENLLSLQRLVANVDRLSMSGKAKLALTYIYAEGGHHAASIEVVANVVDLLLSSIRTQGRTAYVSYGSGSAHADVEASALALEVFARLDRSEQQVEKVAAFVAQQADEGVVYGGWGVTQYAFASLALSAFDEHTSNTKPDVSLDVLGDDNRIMHAAFRSASSSPVNATVPLDALVDEGVDELRFFVEGSGDVSVVAGMAFVPADLPRQGVSRGITVQKVVQRLDMSTGKAAGHNVARLQRGEHARVTIQISNADDLQNVMLWDPLPACVDAIDENVFSVGETSSDVYGASSGYRGGWYYWGWGFSQKEFKREGVQSFANWLSAGTHTVSYTVVASARGHCVIPPAEAWVVKQPEVMGRSAAGSLDTGAEGDALLSDGGGAVFADESVCMQNVAPLLFSFSSVDTAEYSKPSISVVPAGSYVVTTADSGDDESDGWLEFLFPIALLVVGSMVVLGVGVLVFFLIHRAYRRRSDSYATTGTGASMMDLDDDDFI